MSHIIKCGNCYSLVGLRHDFACRWHNGHYKHLDLGLTNQRRGQLHHQERISLATHWSILILRFEVQSLTNEIIFSAYLLEY